MLENIYKQELISTRNGRLIELRYFNPKRDRVRLKSKENSIYSNDGCEWEFQGNYSKNDVIRYNVDGRGEQIGFEIIATNGGYLGDYRNYDDFKNLVEYYMKDKIEERISFTNENKLEFLIKFANEIIENWKNNTADWIKNRIDYLMYTRYSFSKELNIQLSEICLEISLFCTSNNMSEYFFSVGCEFVH